MLSRTLDVLDSFPAMSLDEVMAVADLQVRKDRKYLVDPAHLPSVIEPVVGDVSVLAIDGLRAFRYESTYFDTPDFSTYLAAARSRPRRYKVRTRAYLDSGTCQFEVKVRAARGHTVKHRMRHDFVNREMLTSDARRFVASVPESLGSADHLVPSLCSRYRRSTLVLSSSATRVTVDLDLSCTRPDGASMALGSVAIVETKTHGPPCSVDRALWTCGYRPVAVSKYCIGLATLVPGLPANRWHRVLRRHCVRVSACGSLPICRDPHAETGWG